MTEMMQERIIENLKVRAYENRPAMGEAAAKDVVNRINACCSTRNL